MTVGGIDLAAGYDSANAIFGGSLLASHDFRITVLWWIAITIARHLGAHPHPDGQLDLRRRR